MYLGNESAGCDRTNLFPFPITHDYRSLAARAEQCDNPITADFPHAPRAQIYPARIIRALSPRARKHGATARVLLPPPNRNIFDIRGVLPPRPSLGSRGSQTANSPYKSPKGLMRPLRLSLPGRWGNQA